jgi:hypothetical protein
MERLQHGLIFEMEGLAKINIHILFTVASIAAHDASHS